MAVTHSSRGLKVSAGMDVGDKHSHLCLVDQETGDVIEETRLRTTKAALRRYFDQTRAMRIAIEAGPHSPWLSRLLADCGHEVLVANPHKFRLIHQSRDKTDRRDAEKLARVARFDPKLLSPITHRSERAQADLALIRAREALVECRTKLVMHVRSVLKAFGLRAPRCNTESFHHKVRALLPRELEAALTPLVESIERMTGKIRGFDQRINELAEHTYPETTLLCRVRGVGL